MTIVESRAVDCAGTWRDRLDDWLMGDRHALMASAVCRMGAGLAVLGLLLTNFSTRDMWVGEGAAWAAPARAISQFPELALLDGVSGDILVLVYVLTMLASLALVLGWHAKAANVVTFVGFIAIVGQNPVVGSSGDDLIRLTLLWMLLMRTSERWSLDAYRRERHLAAQEGRSRDEEILPSWLSTGLHNVGLLALGVQTILAAMAGGLDKLTDSGWRQGTALYSTMQLPEFRPFPGLADSVCGSAVALAVLTYGVMLSQLFFGPLLLHATTRRIVIVLAVVVNVLLGVMFGQLWSAVSTLALTALFVSDDTWQRIEHAGLLIWYPVADWCVERRYNILDCLDDIRYRLVFPAVDWIRLTLLRR